MREIQSREKGEIVHTEVGGEPGAGCPESWEQLHGWPHGRSDWPLGL